MIGQEALRPEVIGWLHVLCSLRTVLSSLENSRMIKAGHRWKGRVGTLNKRFPMTYRTSLFCVSHTFWGGSRLLFSLLSPVPRRAAVWNQSATRTGQHLKVTSLAGAVWVEVIADVQCNIQRVSGARAWAVGASTFSGVEGEYESRQDWRTGRSCGAREEKQQSRPLSPCHL